MNNIKGTLKVRTIIWDVRQWLISNKWEWMSNISLLTCNWTHSITNSIFLAFNIRANSQDQCQICCWLNNNNNKLHTSSTNSLLSLWCLNSNHNTSKSLSDNREAAFSSHRLSSNLKFGECRSSNHNHPTSLWVPNLVEVYHNPQASIPSLKPHTRISNRSPSVLALIARSPIRPSIGPQLKTSCQTLFLKAPDQWQRPFKWDVRMTTKTFRRQMTLPGAQPTASETFLKIVQMI